MVNYKFYCPALLIFWFLFSVILYIYIGYPCFLIVIAKFRKAKVIRKKEIFPKVSLIISAYNEEKVIKDRIENILSLKYPKDKLEVIIASDASTDKTDEIILQYKNEGITLNRLPQRKGKMAAFNDCVNKSTGEILVFSDADILFKEDDIEKLVRNFADPTIGCVVGIKRIVTNRDDKANSASEGLYWKYELFLKKMESKIGSVAAGASGCNFAIRRDLYVWLEERTTAEDLVLPLLCISRGFRVHFEPEAISYERLLPSFKDEFKRKIRLVTGGLHAISLIKDKFHLMGKLILFQLFSHKILRWYSSFFLLGLFIVNCFLREGIYYLFLLLQIIFYSLAILGFIFRLTKIKVKGLLSRFFDIPLYFASMNLAAIIGILKYTFKLHKGWISYGKPTKESQKIYGRTNRIIGNFTSL